MSLQSAWIDAIHARLHVRYGSAWLERWKGLEPAAVRADWALVLTGVTGDAIGYALEHLPLDWPPTAGEFRALCIRGFREPEMPKLEAPTADPERVQAVVDRARKMAERRPPKQWAVDLTERERNGEAFTAAQRAMWMAALQRIEEPIAHAGRLIDPATLPPGMRTTTAEHP